MPISEFALPLMPTMVFDGEASIVDLESAVALNDEASTIGLEFSSIISAKSPSDWALKQYYF